jgi:hypothetical protein
MRKWVVILFFLEIAWPAMADKTLSIQQMEQLLIKLHGKPDGKVAGELEDLKLTERVSPARLARWETDFPGKRAQDELTKLADLSAFLNPPASDVLRDPPPDSNTEERMMALAEDYVRLTTVRLPNFYATRETTHFEDALSHRSEYTYSGSMAMGTQGSLGSLPTPTAGQGSTTEYRGLHSTGEFSMTVTYRDGHEVLEADRGKRKKEEESALGLTSSGEFGQVLGAVIDDLVHSGVRWLRWEQGNGEPAAVFGFAVPANQSHFRIGITVDGRAEELFLAYHGEIEIDPATGEILRFSEIADPGPSHPAIRAAIVVEYAPVKIGDQSYIVPVRGVAFSMIPVPSAGATDEASEPVQVNLNDVAFTDYHEFGSEARIVTNANGNEENGAAGGNGAPVADSSAPAATASAPAAPAGSSGTSEPAPGASTPTTEVAAATPVSNAAAMPATSPTANPTGDATEASTAGGAPGPMAAAAVLGATPSTQILFQARVLPEGDPELKGSEPQNGPAGDKSASLKGGAHRYVVDLTVNLESLAFAQSADGKRSTELECALVAYDSDGMSVNSLGRKFDFKITAEQYERLSAEGKGIPVRLALDLPTGANVVRAVVYDPATAKTGSLEIPVQVAAK